MATSIEELRSLSVAERIQLVEDLWDSIAASPAAIPVTEKQRKELDARLEDHAKHPDEGSNWQQVKKRVIGPR